MSAIGQTRLRIDASSMAASIPADVIDLTASDNEDDEGYEEYEGGKVNGDKGDIAPPWKSAKAIIPIRTAGGPIHQHGGIEQYDLTDEYEYPQLSRTPPLSPLVGIADLATAAAHKCPPPAGYVYENFWRMGGVPQQCARLVSIETGKIWKPDSESSYEANDNPNLSLIDGEDKQYFGEENHRLQSAPSRVNHPKSTVRLPKELEYKFDDDDDVANALGFSRKPDNTEFRAGPPPTPDLHRNNTKFEAWGDYLLDNSDDANEADIASACNLQGDGPLNWTSFHLNTPGYYQTPNAHLAPANPQTNGGSEHHSIDGYNQAPVEGKTECLKIVADPFPGVCLEHISMLYDTFSQNPEQLILYLLENSYPKAIDKAKSLKRKRSVDKEREEIEKYDSSARQVPAGANGVRPFIRNILSQEFGWTPMIFVDAIMSQRGYRLYSSYMALEKAQRTFSDEAPEYTKLKVKRKAADQFSHEKIELTLAMHDDDKHKVEVLKELQTARREVSKAAIKRDEEKQAMLDEEANFLQAQVDGTLVECGTCCEDLPMNRLYHCDGATSHFFCKRCCVQLAENKIGAGKHSLECMSMGGACEGHFDRFQRLMFLDEAMIIGLDRNEAEANLRMAGIENLETCPFCPFAAEFLPVEEDREFRCQNEECREVSCRLCREKSHIPLTCEEHKRSNGISVRHEVEEAMSNALIRKCNKCNAPFIKEEGCNKMTCNQSGCHNIQCYICSKSCNYDHFNDRSRGGKHGNCPLFDDLEKRHEDEVKSAEKAALQKVLAAHPEYNEAELTIKVSAKVKHDEEARRRKTAPHQAQAMHENVFDMDIMQAQNQMRNQHVHQYQQAVFAHDQLLNPQPPLPAGPGAHQWIQYPNLQPWAEDLANFRPH